MSENVPKFDADQPESRPNLVCLHGMRNGHTAFVPYPGFKERWTVSVPFSLSLEADEEHGVVLQDVFGVTYTAEQVARFAFEEKPGFKLVTVHVYTAWDQESCS